MKTVLITSRSFGQLSDEPRRILEDAGFQLKFYNETYEEEEFCRQLAPCDALIIGAHQLTEKALQAASNLKIVVKHGAGLDNIDLDMCAAYHVQVENVPAVNSNAVADLAFSLILDVARKTSLAARQVKNYQWKRITGVDVYGKTLGLLGFGAIAKNVARRANGFSMKVLAYDPFVTEVPEEFSSFVTLVSLDEALANSDFLSIHVPLSDKTRNLIGAGELAAMKKGSFLINTSRGGIVNEEALYQALISGHLAGAGLDVIESEPISEAHLLNKLDNVTITPHMGMYSFEAINAVSAIAAQKTADYFAKSKI
ncbi:MAG: phosphoglycerate dehydrogenase [Firmicutes bacterium]|nr:phosphoglycerate dehydrogenase [Bacillota bacterium]